MGSPMIIDVGQRFGKLVIEKEVKIKYGKRHFICRCDCGKKSNPIPLYNLTTGRTISCGCVMRSKARENFKKYNVYKNCEGGVSQCFSPDGKTFLFSFDTEDIDLVNNYCWYTREDGYALANALSGKNKKIRLHRLVMSKYLNIDIEKLDNIDHINGNTRDNRKENLRNISGTENNRSKVMYAKSVESMGVSKFRNSYISKLTCDGVEYSKSFKNKTDAIKHRLVLEFILFGEEFSPQRHLFKKYNINEDTINGIEI